ncbi:MAG: exodeoxyribonuclease VII small subunit [Lachnospiraceae bacterium]|nr:exodeoxyribonuclease VII small subunit [Lachnospiraceae bacterium]
MTDEEFSELFSEPDSEQNTEGNSEQNAGQNAKEKPTLEDRFNDLDAILKKLDDRDLPLEEAFRLYERGVQELKLANAEIDRVEKKVLKLNEDGSLSPLDQEGE